MKNKKDIMNKLKEMQEGLANIKEQYNKSPDFSLTPFNNSIRSHQIELVETTITVLKRVLSE